MDARTLLLGDWWPALRDPIDLVRAGFPVGALAFVLAGKDGAGMLAVAGLVAWAVRFLDLPRLYDLSVALALVFAAWGEALRVYDAFPAYDIVTHLLVPLLGAPVIYIALARLEVVPDPADETSTPPADALGDARRPRAA